MCGGKDERPDSKAVDKCVLSFISVTAQEASGRNPVRRGDVSQLLWKRYQQLAEKRHPLPRRSHRPRKCVPVCVNLHAENSHVRCSTQNNNLFLQTWTPHYFVLTSNKIYYSEETSHYQTADEEEDDEGKEVGSWWWWWLDLIIIIRTVLMR